MAGGCNHFERIDDALCHRVKSMVAVLLVKNDNIGNEIEKLHKVSEEMKAEAAEGEEQEAEIAGECVLDKGEIDIMWG